MLPYASCCSCSCNCFSVFVAGVVDGDDNYNGVFYVAVVYDDEEEVDATDGDGDDYINDDGDTDQDNDAMFLMLFVCHVLDVGLSRSAYAFA